MRFEPTLVVERMLITRGPSVAFDEKFHAGVNVISGENSSGKSTILNFLFYGLGGDLIDWSAVAKLCDRVYIQASLNGNLISLSREVSSTSKRPMDIFFGELDEAVGSSEGWLRYPYSRSDSKESFSQALFRILGIPEVLNDISGNLTFNQMLRILYADQLTPVESLFKYQGAFDDVNLRDAIGRLIFGAHSGEYYENITRIRSLKRQYDELNGEYRSLISAAGEVSEGFTHEWVRAERLKIQQEIAVVESAVADLRKSEGRSEDEYSLVALEKAYDRTVFLQGRIAELSNDRDVLAVRISDSRRFIASLRNKLEALSDSSMVSASLGQVKMSECPACHATLSEQLFGHCYLCQSPMENGADRARITHLINDTAQQERESSELLENRLSDAREIDMKIARARTEWEEATKELASLRDTASPAREQELSEANRRLGYLNRQLDDNRRLGELANRIEQLGARRSDVRREIDELDAKNEALERQQSERLGVVSSAVADEVRTLLINDLRRQDVFEDPKEVTFSFRDNFISINQERYFSASSRAILKSSFVLALIGAATKVPYMRHPRFCMIDSLENMGVEPVRSANFQEQILAISEAAKVEHQIIFATAMLSKELNSSRYIVGRHYTRDDPSLNIG